MQQDIEMQKAYDKYMKVVNPYITNSKIQKLSEFYPLHNMVLCAPYIIKQESSSGIIIPEHIRAQQTSVINDALALQAIKVGAEVKVVREGDFVFCGTPETPVLIPLIDDLGDGQVRQYKCYPENWIAGVLRENANPNDFKVAIPHTENTYLSLGKTPLKA